MRLLKIQLAKQVTKAMWQLRGKPQQLGANLPVLCYHRVLPELIEGEEPVFTVQPAQFEAQLDYLVRHDIQTLSLSEYWDIKQGLRPMPERAVLLTFDDGFADFYYHAWPLAQRYGCKLNLFLCTGLVEEQQPAIYEYLPFSARRHVNQWPALWRSLSWEQARELSANGVEFGLHGHRHIRLSRLMPDELRADFQTASQLFATQLNVRPRFFALPEGTYGSYNQSVMHELHTQGVSLIFTTHMGRTSLTQPGGLCARIVVHQEDDLETFERKLYGAYDWLGQWRLWGQICQSKLNLVPSGTVHSVDYLNQIIPKQAHSQD